MKGYSLLIISLIMTIVLFKCLVIAGINSAIMEFVVAVIIILGAFILVSTLAHLLVLLIRGAKLMISKRNNS